MEQDDPEIFRPIHVTYSALDIEAEHASVDSVAVHRMGFLAAAVLDAGLLGFLFGVLIGIAASALYLVIAVRLQR